MLELAASGLSASLGQRLVLHDIDFILQPGRFTVVVGPNGSGKTTLLKVLAGLLPADAGTVLLGGRPVRSLASAARARAIAYLPQGGTVAWPLPVASVAALGRLPHGEDAEALPRVGREAVARAIAAVGLGGFEARAATALSGGERARVLLARALATEAPVLLADEPVAALDPHHQLLVLDRLRERARSGTIAAAVMHDLALAARFADEIVLLDRGRVAASGSPEAVLTARQLAASFRIDAKIVRQDGIVAVIPLRPLGFDE
jgi:iron complex transport system ATP-binding protein